MTGRGNINSRGPGRINARGGGGTAMNLAEAVTVVVSVDAPPAVALVGGEVGDALFISPQTQNNHPN